MSEDPSHWGWHHSLGSGSWIVYRWRNWAGCKSRSKWAYVRSFLSARDGRRDVANFETPALAFPQGWTVTCSCPPFLSRVALGQGILSQPRNKARTHGQQRLLFFSKSKRTWSKQNITCLISPGKAYAEERCLLDRDGTCLGTEGVC